MSKKFFVAGGNTNVVADLGLLNVVVRPWRAISLALVFLLTTSYFLLPALFADDAEVKLNSNDGSTGFIIQNQSGIGVFRTGSDGFTSINGSATVNSALGIGTTNPLYPLDVNGNGFLAGQLMINSNLNDGKLSVVTNSAGVPAFYANQFGSADIAKFLSNTNEIMTIKSNGNVGISTPTPSAKLDVNGDLKLAVPLAPSYGGTGRTNKLSAVQVVGTTDISTGNPLACDMPDMLATITTYGTKLLVIFSAPLSVSGVSLSIGKISINIDNSDKRAIYVPYTANSYPLQYSFQHLETDLTPGVHTVKIRWSISSGIIYQRGTTHSERILTVLDLE